MAQNNFGHSEKGYRVFMRAVRNLNPTSARKISFGTPVLLSALLLDRGDPVKVAAAWPDANLSTRAPEIVGGKTMPPRLNAVSHDMRASVRCPGTVG